MTSPRWIRSPATACKKGRDNDSYIVYDGTQYGADSPVPAAKNGSERCPVSYRTLDDANSYFPGRNDPNKNLEINKKKFMG